MSFGPGTYVAKTFTIPDVQVGSILEYRYKLTWNKAWIYSTTWTVDGFIGLGDESQAVLQRAAAGTGGK
jgi:hypothetical protein